MSDKRATAMSKTLLPDLPKDVPMPRFRYQQDERSIAKGAAVPEDLKQKAATLLAGLNLMGCASKN